LNKPRRDSLKCAIDLLKRAEFTIERVCDEEKDSMDNVPENLQSSDRYIAMEKAVDYLEDAIGSIQEAATNVECAVNER